MPKQYDYWNFSFFIDWITSPNPEDSTTASSAASVASTASVVSQASVASIVTSEAQPPIPAPAQGKSDLVLKVTYCLYVRNFEFDLITKFTRLKKNS